MPSIIKPRCEYRENPLGIDVVQPRFSWQTKCRRPGIYQIAYRVTVASSPQLLESDQSRPVGQRSRESDQSLHVVYAGTPLQSRQRAYWRVVVWDESGEYRTSDTCWFEMGLLDRSEWQAEWIGGSLVGGAYSTVPAPYVRGVTSAYRLPYSLPDYT